MLRGIYRPLGFDYAEQLQRQLYTYVVHYSGVYGNKIFWTPTDVVSVISHCSLLLNIIELIGVEPRTTSIIQVDDRDNHSIEKIHVDSDKEVILLMPVLNCETTETIFYDVPETDLVLKELSNSKDVPYFTTKQSSYPVLGKLRLTGPTIFNTGIPHGIQVPNNSPLPRISMAMRFRNTIDHLLNI